MPARGATTRNMPRRNPQSTQPTTNFWNSIPDEADLSQASTPTTMNGWKWNVYTPQTQTEASASVPKFKTEASRRAELISNMSTAEDIAKNRGNISKIDELTDSDLKRCFEIADKAAKSVHPSAKVTPAMMDEFLDLVFEEWNTRYEATVDELVDPQTDVYSHSFVIGLLDSDDEHERKYVYQVANLTLDPPELAFTLEYFDKDKYLTAADASQVVWYDADKLKAATKDVLSQTWKHVKSVVVPYNRDRAVQYARKMLRYRALGLNDFSSAQPAYEFANSAVLWASFPVLSFVDEDLTSVSDMFSPWIKRYDSRHDHGFEDPGNLHLWGEWDGTGAGWESDPAEQWRADTFRRKW